MKYFRKIHNNGGVNKRYMYISIPIVFKKIFESDMATIEPLPDGAGITVRPARIVD